MSILFFAGSLRSDSCNKKFAREAQRVAKEAGIDGKYIDIKEYVIPVYDGDVEATSGLPEGVKKLSQEIQAASALVISTPEYNGSIPGPLKNIIDWLSRDKPMPLTDKHLLLLAASPGGLGGVRSLWHTRQPFEALGVFVFPNMMGLPRAYEAFDDQGRLKDEKTSQQLLKTLTQYAKHVRPSAV